MSLVNREIVLKGFNGRCSRSDDLVLWVAGEECDIDRIAKKMGSKVRGVFPLEEVISEPLSFQDAVEFGFDFDLPKDERLLVERVNELMQRPAA